MWAEIQIELGSPTFSKKSVIDNLLRNLPPSQAIAGVIQLSTLKANPHIFQPVAIHAESTLDSLMIVMVDDPLIVRIHIEHPTKKASLRALKTSIRRAVRRIQGAFKKSYMSIASIDIAVSVASEQAMMEGTLRRFWSRFGDSIRTYGIAEIYAFAAAVTVALIDGSISDALVSASVVLFFALIWTLGDTITRDEVVYVEH